MKIKRSQVSEMLAAKKKSNIMSPKEMRIKEEKELNDSIKKKGTKINKNISKAVPLLKEAINLKILGKYESKFKTLSSLFKKNYTKANHKTIKVIMKSLSLCNSRIDALADKFHSDDSKEGKKAKKLLERLSNKLYPIIQDFDWLEQDVFVKTKKKL